MTKLRPTTLLTSLLWGAFAWMLSIGMTSARADDYPVDYPHDLSAYIGLLVAHPSLSASDVQMSGSTVQGGIVMGGRMTDHVAMEAMYTATSFVNSTQTDDVSLIVISLVGKTPLDDDGRYSVYGRLGYALANVSVVNVGSNNHGDMTYGAGMEFAMDNGRRRAWNLRVGVDRYSIGSLSVLTPGVTPAKDYMMSWGLQLLHNY